MNNILRLIALFFVFTLNAQELDLNSAIQLAKTNNRSLQNANSDIKIAQQKRLETIASGLPQISLSANYNNAFDQPVSLVPGQYFGGVAGEYSAVTFGTSQSVSAGLTLNQMIFDGTYLVGLQASEIYLRISQQAYVKTEQAVEQAAVEAYVNTLLAKVQLVYLNQNLSLAKNNLKEARQVFKNGFIEEENVQQLQLTVAALESTLQYATQMHVVAKNVLRYVLGMDLDEPLSLSSSLEGLVLEMQNTTDGSLSVSENIDYQMAQNDVRSKELLLKLERFKALPTIKAFLSGGYDGFGDNFDFTQPSQDWYGRAVMGVNLSVPVFSSFQSKAKRQQAKLALNQSENQAQNVVQEILLEESRMRSEVQFQLENVQTTAQSLRLAEDIARKNEIKFKEGLVSGFTLRQIQTQLYEAQNNYLNAMQQLVVSKTKLSLLLNPVTQTK
jgi:outer membrane protein TolC